MEESEKRRERLKAMRMEAAQTETSNSDETYKMPGSPSNPLIEPFGTQPSQDTSTSVSRFDFYTDPMAAFSGSKRRSKDSNQAPQDYSSPPITNVSPMVKLSSPLSGPGNYDMNPAHRFPMNYTPIHRMHEPPFPYFGSGPRRSPMGMTSPFPSNCGTPPGPWNTSGSTPGYGFPSNSPRGGGFPSPSFGRGGSPSPNSGRGRGRWFNNSPNPSPSSGRGSSGRRQSFHGGVSAQERPDLFYDKSMVEDPWRFLKPVIRDSRPWLPNSLSLKKAKVSEAPNEVFNSESSLADCFASSFEEAINDAANV